MIYAVEPQIQRGRLRPMLSAIGLDRIPGAPEPFFGSGSESKFFDITLGVRRGFEGPESFLHIVWEAVKKCWGGRCSPNAYAIRFS